MQKLTYITASKVTPVWADEKVLKIKNTLCKKHSVSLENETFDIEAGYTKAQVQMRIALCNLGKNIYYPVECVFIRDIEEIQPENAALLMLDYLDTYWATYFREDRNVFVPLDWDKHEFEGFSFYIRGFLRHLNLEEQADALLSEHGHGELEIYPISAEL